MLLNIPLPNLETNENKNGKNAATDSCHSSENNSSDGNESGAGNTSNEAFFNN